MNTQASAAQVAKAPGMCIDQTFGATKQISIIGPQETFATAERATGKCPVHVRRRSGSTLNSAACIAVARADYLAHQLVCPHRCRLRNGTISFEKSGM